MVRLAGRNYLFVLRLLSEWTFDKATGKPIEFIQDPGLVGGQGSVVKIPLEGNLLF